MAVAVAVAVAVAAGGTRGGGCGVDGAVGGPIFKFYFIILLKYLIFTSMLSLGGTWYAGTGTRRRFPRMSLKRNRQPGEG